MTTPKTPRAPRASKTPGAKQQKAILSNEQRRINATALRAAGEGDISELRRLAPLATNWTTPPDGSPGERPTTPLRIAAANGQAYVIQMLLPLSRERNPLDVIDALVSALQFGHADCARELALAIPADFFLLPAQDKTAAELLEQVIRADKNQSACLQIIVGLVGEPLMKSCANEAFRLAARFQKPELLRMLLPFADPNATDEQGNTALTLSCVSRYGAPDIDGRATAFLLPLTDASLLNNDGQNAWTVAFRHHSWPSLDVLTLDRLQNEPQPRDPKLLELLTREKDNLPISHACLEAEQLAAVMQQASPQSVAPLAPAPSSATAADPAAGALSNAGSPTKRL